MVIMAKAMTITHLKAKLDEKATEEILQSFADTADTVSWARSGIADSVQAGIVSGRNGAKLAPKAPITRAEVAAMIQRLLKQSELI